MIKESLKDLWGYQSLTSALKHFKSCYGWAIRSRLKPVKAVARKFRNREYFNIAIDIHCEGLDLLPVTHQNVG